MPNPLADVIAFHQAFKIPTAPHPVSDADFSIEGAKFRERFLREELTEYSTALMAGDQVGVADALADLAYVALGGLVQLFGTEAAAGVWDEVQRSNMQKVLDPSGAKHVRKPEGWLPPMIATALLKAAQSAGKLTWNPLPLA